MECWNFEKYFIDVIFHYNSRMGMIVWYFDLLPEHYFTCLWWLCRHCLWLTVEIISFVWNWCAVIKRKLIKKIQSCRVLISLIAYNNNRNQHLISWTNLQTHWSCIQFIFCWVLLWSGTNALHQLPSALFHRHRWSKLEEMGDKLVWAHWESVK